MSIPKKPRKCRVCKKDFQPTRPLQTVCCVECAFEQAKFARAKDEKTKKIEEHRADKERRERMKTLRDWTKEAQIAFNAYIRERDKFSPCICCGKPLESGGIGGSFDCGHYRSVGSAPHLRFDERNAHGQRKQCNRYGAGRAVDYRIGLIARLGADSVESLESDQQPRHYSIEELKAIKSKYTAKLKELKKQ